MDVRRFETVEAFLAGAGGFLAAREAEHNLIFGICSNVQANPGLYGGTPPYLAVVLHGSSVVAAAIRTPPWRLVLSEIDHPTAVQLLAADLDADDLPGVQGPAGVASAFATAWTRRTGRPARALRHLRIFQLTNVTQPILAPGHMADATPADRTLVATWLRAFHDEALSGNPERDYDDMAARFIAGQGRRLVLWIDDGRPVSLTGIGGRTPNGIRIGPVYTPPELRDRGYASNLVAEASQAELDAGRRFVFLFTDLANPTANRIYQAIGYEPIGDVDEFAFG
ncbi:MAG TPA: GNAT family N-acetyltransferase [Candidatus Deferrimicrobiaceae bacterium]|nr:GNAT family N-acetyltransferase [Candidatus Deferrimicrobiaceae bacterium]